MPNFVKFNYQLRQMFQWQGSLNHQAFLGGGRGGGDVRGKV
jgi:hypothetical protein